MCAPLCTNRLGSSPRDSSGWCTVIVTTEVRYRSAWSQYVGYDMWILLRYGHSAFPIHSYLDFMSETPPPSYSPGVCVLYNSWYTWSLQYEQLKHSVPKEHTQVSAVKLWHTKFTLIALSSFCGSEYGPWCSPSYMMGLKFQTRVYHKV